MTQGSVTYHTDPCVVNDCILGGNIDGKMVEVIVDSILYLFAFYFLYVGKTRKSR